MLLGIFSDSHLGFGSDDRFEEAFARFKESIRIFKERNADYLLHAGDLFDSAVPEQEVWKKTFECFNENNSKYSTLQKCQLSGSSEVCVKGIPIIAIHGTHEFRGKDFTNAIAILEEANCLVHLHAGSIGLEKNGEKVFIHGMGGVPEKHAKDALEKYSPKPIQNSTNLLLLHQSFKEFLPFDDDEMIATLSLSDLPDGFDLIVDGHLHWKDEQVIGEKKFLLAGSSIFTQMKHLESQREKGVFLFDTKSKKLEFIPFKNQRKLFYAKFDFKNALPEEVVATVNAKINECLSSATFETKPLVRLKICGTLAKGFTQSDVSIVLPNNAIFSVSKNLSVDSFEKKIESLKAAHLEKKSVTDFGIDLLEKNVDEAGLKEFDTRRLFDLLSIGENEKAESVLINAQKVV
ncbi:MAG: metallophosphoesterase [archaeon]|jgi:DNA repair exonuclease SbcCD nuclease subunit